MLLIDRTWDEVQAYIKEIKIKYEHLEYLAQQGNHLGLHVPTLTINSDHQSIKDAITYVNEQEDLHNRIMVLHHELISIGGNAMAPSPPYKKT